MKKGRGRERERKNTLEGERGGNEGGIRRGRERKKRKLEGEGEKVKLEGGEREEKRDDNESVHSVYCTV